MPKQHVPTFIETMGKEVFELFEEKQEFSLAAFKPAFRDVAHKHKIWHHVDAKEYNRFFGWVMKEVKLLIKKQSQSQEVQQTQRKIVIPQLDPEKLRYTINLF